MKYIFSTLVVIILCLVSCNSASTNTPPPICDCVKNGLQMLNQQSGFDKALQTECEEYSATLTEGERAERNMEGRDCLTN